MSGQEPIAVLITSAGSAAALNCMKALRRQAELSIRLVAVDADPLSAGLYKADVGYTVPLAAEENFIDVVMDICEKEGVKVVLPMFSGEMSVFASNASTFEAKAIHLLVSPVRSVATFANKWLAYAFFRRHGVPTASTWLSSEVPAKAGYPLYLKPILGSGSRDAYRIDSAQDLAFYQSKVDRPCVVQPFLKGPEFTIDIVADRDSRVIAAVPRERVRVRHGMSVVARPVDDKGFLAEAARIVSLAGLVGPINMQGILTDEGFRFLDINTRFAAGGLPLTIATGNNMPLKVVKLALGLSVPPSGPPSQNLTMIRYYTEVFVLE